MYREQGKKARFIIPTGNLGNGVACYWAREMGFPIEKIALALNANRALYNYSQGDDWAPAQSLPTLANAMDVGNPSNFARLSHLLPKRDEWLKITDVVSASDQNIRDTIIDVFNTHAYEICPHTATAYYTKQKLKWDHAICVATAHPAKFDTIVEPLINQSVALPSALKDLLTLPGKKTDIPVDLSHLASVLKPRQND